MQCHFLWLVCFCHDKLNGHVSLHVKEMIDRHQVHHTPPYNNPMNYSMRQSVNKHGTLHTARS